MGAPNSKARRAKRREEAIERQAKYDALSADEKVAVARSRRGHSEREVRRIMDPNGATHLDEMLRESV